MTNIARLDILEVVNRIIKTPIDESQINTEFKELGVESIDFVRIIIELETQYLLEIPDEYLILHKMNSVNKIFEVLNDLR